jgi:DNA invertase Pin-like site-specific DNA recombinase
LEKRLLFEMQNPSSKAMASMIAVFTEFEGAVLQERVKPGMAHAKAKGITLGRPATAQAQADQIHQLLAAGMSKKAHRTGVGLSCN